MGRAWSEADLIGYAYAFEQRTMVRDQVQPYLVPTVELVNVVGLHAPNTSVPMSQRIRRRY